MTSDPRQLAPSQFYTGLVADLYDSLVSVRARGDDYVGFLDRGGTPALELGCGSGLPLIELLERGYEVEGLDASHDMLELCRARARARKVNVVLHQAQMQAFSLPRRYRSIFLAGASFTLLTSDADAAGALACIYAHLEPGGSVLIPLERDVGQPSARTSRELPTDSGELLRVTELELERDADGCDARRRIRYERIRVTGERDCVERDWRRRSWPQPQFRELLASAGFEKVRFRNLTGGEASPDAPFFVALAKRPGEER